MTETTGARKSATAPKKAAVKKAAVKKAAPKKAAVKKAAVKKAAPKKAAVKKAPKDAPSPGAAMLAELVDARTTAAAERLLPHAPIEPPLARPPSRFSRRATAIAAAAAIAVVALAGGVFAMTRNSPPSKAQFLATAEALCRPANGPVTAIVKPTSYPELATAAATVVTATDSQLQQLRALARPNGQDGRAASSALDAFGGTSAAAKLVQDAASKKDDPAAVSATHGLRKTYDAAAVQGTSFGFTACTVGMRPGVDNVVAGSHAVLKAGFVAKADGLCRASAGQLDKVVDFNEYSPPSEVVRFFGQAYDIFAKLTTDLKAIPVPPGDEAPVAEMFSAADRANANLAELRDAAAANDVARLTAAGKEEATLTTAVDAKLDAYGLGTCGSKFGD